MLSGPDENASGPDEKASGADGNGTWAGAAAVGADAGFDYMQAGNENHQAEALAQEYIEELLQRSAPATYLPLLMHVVQASDLPLAIQVGCCCSCMWYKILACVWLFRWAAVLH